MATTTKEGDRSKSLPTTHRERRPRPEQTSGRPSGPTEKPIPNYLKPTVSSRPNPGKFVKKNNNVVEDNQKPLGRRSFDKPPSSLISPPPSPSPSRHVQKSLNVSPGRSGDRPLIRREKVTAAAARPSSSHSSKSGSSASKVNPRAARVKSPVASRASNVTKKSGISSASSRKKEDAATAVSNKVAVVNAAETENETMSLEGNQESLSDVQEVEQEIVKVATEIIQLFDEPKKPQDEEVQVEAVETEVEEDKEETDQTDIYPVSYSPVACKEEEVINEDPESGNEEKIEDKTEEKTNNLMEEAKESDRAVENNEDKSEGEVEAETEVEDDEGEGTIANTDPTDFITVTTKIEEDGDNEKEDDQEKEKEIGVEEGSSVEWVLIPKATESPDLSKRQAVQGRKESPAAYNDVIEETRRKLLEERKNKVKALVGAFETVIDYESASSK